MLSKALAWMKLQQLPAFRPKECSPSFRPRATICARRQAWPNSFRPGSLRPAPHKSIWTLGELSMSISREQIRELAEFQYEKSCAVSFYFQPSTPRNKAHKEDVILIKDLARESLRGLENQGRRECARSD